MNMKFIRYIALILCFGFICGLSVTQQAYAQANKGSSNALEDFRNSDAYKRLDEEYGNLNNYDSRHNQAERDATFVDNRSAVAYQINNDPNMDGKKAIETINENNERLANTSVRDPASRQTSTCEGDYQPTNQDAGTTPNASGMFSDSIMRGMQEFMREVYRQLSKVFMIGHSLLCYAQKVAYTCLGWEDVTGCFAKFPNMNLLVSGLVIYIVGVLMTMSIGMYFVDISFKLGFAVLFMPVTIALWPFSPTKNKLSENLSIIIRNGMLFTLVAIGVSFAVTLISNSLLDTGDGRDGWTAFWQAVANKRTQSLTDSFAFDRMHFLVVCFALIFAFKILASSVNDYLDYFFSDSVFGSESPMHHMGTQAVGMAAANVVKPAASFVADVAKTQGGRAIAGVGGGIAALGSKDGRQRLAGNFKKFTGAVTNPRRTYNAAMGKLGEKTNQAVQGIGSLVKGATNVGTLVLPIKESTRKRLEEKADKAIDKYSAKIGAWAENKVAHGGAELQNAAADITAAGINMYNKNVLGKDNPSDFVTREDVKGRVNQSINSVKEDIKSAGRAVKSGAKNMAAGAAAAVYNTGQMMSGTPQDMKTGDDIIDDLQDLRLGIQDKVDKLAQTELGKETALAWKTADKAPITLQPSAGIENAFKLAKGAIKAPFKLTGGTAKGAYNLVVHPQKTIRQLAQATADNYFKAKDVVNKTAQDAQQLKTMLSSEQGRKIILQKTGRIVLRTAARTTKGIGQDAQRFAEGGATVLGNILKDFGKSLQNNRPTDDRSKWKSWKDIGEAEERKKEAMQEESDYFKSINNYDDD